MNKGREKLIGQLKGLIFAAHGNEDLTRAFGRYYYPGICFTPQNIADFCSGLEVGGKDIDAWAEQCIGPGLDLEKMNDLASSLYEGEEEEGDKAALTEADAKKLAEPIDKLVEAANSNRQWAEHFQIKLEPVEE